MKQEVMKSLRNHWNLGNLPKIRAFWGGFLTKPPVERWPTGGLVKKKNAQSLKLPSYFALIFIEITIFTLIVHWFQIWTAYVPSDMAWKPEHMMVLSISHLFRQISSHAGFPARPSPHPRSELPRDYQVASLSSDWLPSFSKSLSFPIRNSWWTLPILGGCFHNIFIKEHISASQTGSFPTGVKPQQIVKLPPSL